MKTTIYKSMLLLAITAGIFSSCVNDDDYETPTFGCTETDLVKNLEVAQVPAAAAVAQFTEDKVIEAYVTSSDREGNFFKTISLQTIDGSRAFSVPVDVSSTFINYEPGRKVFIKLKDLYTDLRDGGVRIGGIFVSNGSAQVGRMPEALYRSALVRSCVVVSEEDLVQQVTIPQLLNDSYINKLVEISDVQFSDAAITTSYYDENSPNTVGGATNHSLVDESGNSIVFRTSSFASFAGRPVATGKGKVRGVLTKFGTTYQFLARSESDIQLTGPRLSPLFSENFETVPTGTTAFITLPGWTNVQMNGSDPRWTGRIFNGEKYAQMSAFNSGNTNVDSRLITPGINLDATTDEFLRFGYKTGFANGIGLSVWYSTDYDGSGTVAAVNAATWTQFTIPLNVQDTSYSPTFYPSGNIDLSGISGTVYLSFRYVGSSAGITTTYQVDNIEVYGNN